MANINPTTRPGAARPGLALGRTAALAFAVSLATRLVWVSGAHVTPVSDYAGYDRLAVRWLETGRFGAPGWLAYRTPGYPAFLAAVYWVFGHGPKAAGFAQAVLGAGTAGLLVLLAGRFVSIRAAAVAGLLHAGWPTAVIYVPVLASENLAVPLLLATLLGITWPRRSRAWPAAVATALGGVGGGLLLLVRPAAAFFLPAFIGLGVARGRGWGRLLRPAGVGLMVVVTLLPWFARNHRAGLGPCTLSTVGGMNLWMGNSPGQTRGGNLPENLLPAGVGEKERDNAQRQLAVAWIRQNPGSYLALCATRACRLLLTEPDSTAGRYVRPTLENDRLIVADFSHRRGDTAPPEVLRASYEVRLRNNAVLRWFRVATAPLLVLALALALPQWRRYGAFTATFLCYGAGLSATMFAPRFRELGEPLLLVPAATLIVDLAAGSRELRGQLPRWALAFIVGIATAATAILEYHEILPRLYRLATPVGSTQPATPAQGVLDVWRQPGPFRFEWPRGAVVNLSEQGGGLRCDVTGDTPTSARANQGGVRLMVEVAEGLELDLVLLNSAAIKSVHVETRDVRNRIVQQWLWRINPRRPPDEQRRTYVFRAGSPAGPFVPRPGVAGAGQAAQVCVYVTRTGADAVGFVLHRVVASTGGASPDTGADSPER